MSKMWLKNGDTLPIFTKKINGYLKINVYIKCTEQNIFVEKCSHQYATLTNIFFSYQITGNI